MSMTTSIRTNLTSMMTRRHLSKANSALTGSIERLSTGQRINSAADDAGGLAVSEQMKADIRDMTQAKRNANDGVSMLQTAESSLGQVHDILGRMKELSVQANSDSINNDARSDLQEEFSQLSKELDDIADETNFNGLKLLDGTFTGKTLQVGPDASQNVSINITQDFEADFLGDEIGLTGGQMNAVSGANVSFGAAADANEFASGQKYVFQDQSGNQVTATVVGVSTAGAANVVNFDTDLNAQSIGGADTLSIVGGVGLNTISTKRNASFVAGAVQEAIQRVSSERANLGAQINRLGNKLDNLSITHQELSAANSRIRDVDVAKEMSNLTKNQILTQAGTSMLSQANSRPQQALSLLGG